LKQYCILKQWQTIPQNNIVYSRQYQQYFKL
jgi:hypothetical protein